MNKSINIPCGSPIRSIKESSNISDGTDSKSINISCGGPIRRIQESYNCSDTTITVNSGTNWVSMSQDGINGCSHSGGIVSIDEIERRERIYYSERKENKHYLKKIVKKCLKKILPKIKYNSSSNKNDIIEKKAVCCNQYAGNYNRPLGCISYNASNDTISIKEHTIS